MEVDGSVGGGGCCTPGGHVEEVATEVRSVTCVWKSLRFPFFGSKGTGRDPVLTSTQ